MLTMICLIFMVVIFGKMFGFAVRATWGLTKILFGIVFLPLMLIGLLIAGLAVFALPLLILIAIIFGIVALVK